MSHLAPVLLLVSQAADEGPRDLAPEQVSPGIGGFLVFFLLALASWLLYRSFTTHMRRVDVRARRNRTAEQEQEPPKDQNETDS